MKIRMLVCLILAEGWIGMVPGQIKPLSTPMSKITPLTIEGRVEAEQGYVMSGRATVRLYRSTELVKEVLAEEDGRFDFVDVQPGRYRVSALLDGFLPVEENIDVIERGRSVMRVVIRLKATPTAVRIPGSPTVTVDELKVPKKAWQEYLRAEEDLHDRKFPSAMRRFQKALALHPPFLKAWLGLGVAARCLNDAGTAEKAFREALGLDPRNLMARLNLAELCAATGRPEEAREVLVETVGIHPEEGEPHLNLGKLHYQAGRLEEAEAEWRLAARLAHTRPEVHLLLARIYQRQGRIPELKEQLEAYLEKAPETPQAEKIRQSLAAAKAK